MKASLSFGVVFKGRRTDLVPLLEPERELSDRMKSNSQVQISSKTILFFIQNGMRKLWLHHVWNPIEDAGVHAGYHVESETMGESGLMLVIEILDVSPHRIRVDWLDLYLGLMNTIAWLILRRRWECSRAIYCFMGLYLQRQALGVRSVMIKIPF